MKEDETMNVDPWTIGTSLEDVENFVKQANELFMEEEYYVKNKKLTDEIAALKEALRDNEVEIYKLRKENKELRCKYTAQMTMYKLCKHLYSDNLPLENKEAKDVPGIHIENIYITNYKIDPTRTDEEGDDE